MQFTATQLLSLLLAADQIFAKLTEVVKSAKDLSKADEATVVQAIRGLEERNDKRYAEVHAALAKRAAE